MSFISALGGNIGGPTTKLSSQLYDAGGAFYNVKTSIFSAKGDGTTDDTTAIQAAINACSAAGGGEVFFPRGRYRLTSTITVPSGITLQGVGTVNNPTNYDSNRTAQSVSVLDGQLGAGNALVQAVNVYGVNIRDLGFSGIGSSGYCLHLDRMRNSTVERIWCQGATVSNLWIGSAAAGTNTQFCTFKDITLLADNVMSSSPLWIGSTSSANVCHCTFENVIVTHGTVSDSNPGVYVGWSDNCRFVGLYIFRNAGTAYGILLDGAAVGQPPNSHVFLHLEAGSGGLHATSGAQGVIYGYDRSNGEPAPVIDAGAIVPYTTMYPWATALQGPLTVATPAGTLQQSGLLYVATAASTAINTTSTETAFSTQYQFPANSLTAGKVVRIQAGGIFSTSGTPTLDFKVRLEKAGPVETTLLDLGAVGLINNASNVYWLLDVTLTVRAAGVIVGRMISGLVSGGAPYNLSGRLAATPSGGVAVDTTVAQTLQISATWGTASPSNTITVEHMTVEAQG